MKRALIALSLALGFCSVAAAQVPISGLPSATTPLAGSEVVAVVQSAQTRKATVTSLVTPGAGLSQSGSTLSLTSPVANSFISGAYSGITTLALSSKLTVGTTLQTNPLYVVGPTGGNQAVVETSSGLNGLELLSHNGGSNFGSTILFQDGATNSAQLSSVASGAFLLGTGGVNSDLTIRIGPKTAVNGSVVGIDTSITDGITSPNVYAGYLSGPVYTGFNFNRSWDNTHTGSGLAATVSSNAYVNGATTTPMPYFGVCFNQTTGGHCEGMNLIVTDDNSHTLGSANGMEIDMEASTGHQPTSNANGLVVGALNTNYSNGINIITSGGSWANGILLSGTYNSHQIQGNGFNIDTSGNYVPPSDIRLKDVISPITRAVRDLSTLRTFYYTCKPGHAALCVPGRTKIGFSAQEVEKVYPQLVDTDPDGWKSVDYMKMVVPLVEAVRELKADNDNLKAEVKVLEREVHRRAR